MKKANRKPFTEEEKAYIKKYRLKGSKFLAKKLEVSKSKVLTYMRRAGLSLSKEEVAELKRSKKLGKTSFTPEMDAYLKANYLKMPIKTIGEKIGKSYCGIKIRLRQLNLVIPKEIRQKHQRESRFQKGFTPFNKGKSISEWMAPEKQPNIKKGQFKKGQMPHNLKPIGTVREKIDKTGRIYLEKKIAHPNKWKFVHHIVFEEATGIKIPKDKMVIFKDGNTRNFQIKNLELIKKLK